MSNLFNSMMALLPADGWQRLMVDAMWQSTLVGLIGLVMVRYFVHQAAARAWVLAVALTACIVLPMLSVSVRSAGWAFPFRGPTAEMTIRALIQPLVPDNSVQNESASDRPLMAIRNRPRSIRSAAGSEQSTATASLAAPEPTPLQATIFTSDSLNRFGLFAFGAVWLSSGLFLLVKLLASSIAVRRMIRNSHPCKDSILLDAVAVASQRAGLRGAPRVLVSHRISAPMVLAYFRPALVLPKDTVKQQDQNHLATMFAHELAHIRRRDGWSRLWVQLIAVVLPLQPLVWRMRRSFFESCEEACDDWAVATGSDPVDLASVLTAWSGGSRDCRELLLAVGMSGTRSRVLRLLAMDDTPLHQLSGRCRFGATIVAMLICGGLAIAQPPGPVDRTEADEKVEQESGNSSGKQPSNHLSPEGTNAPAKAMTITGRCVDENDKPLPLARVRLFRFGPDGSHPTRTKQTELQGTSCDGAGRFEFKDIERSHKFDSWIVIAQHRGRATSSTFIAAEAPGDQTVELKLPPAGILKGRIANEEGNAVQGVLVSAGSPLVEPVPGICAAISDADGYYEISDLRSFDVADQEPQPTGDGAFMSVSHCYGRLLHPGYARDRFPYSKIPGVANVTVRRPAVVEGQIVLKESGSPAAGARVEFWNDTIAPDSWTRATTDDEGRYQIENLPPGDYHVNVKLAGRPNLALPEVALTAGSNLRNFQMERGGVIKGRVINVRTEQPVQLAEGEIMQISASDAGGRWFSGMASANIQPDGTFTLLMPAGRGYFGMYMERSKWRGVNTDRLLSKGIDVIEGKTTELEIRVKPREKNPSPPKALSTGATKHLAEQAAMAAIKQLGGWVELETIDGKEHVVEVNMVYHEDERMGREENRLICDECLSYVQKFPKLKRLLLYREQATDTGLKKIRGMASLEGIWVWDASAVSDTGAAHLATLKNLKVIHLGNAKLTDEALKHFGSLPKIEDLSLQGNHFTNKGLEFLQESTQLKELTLGLGTNEITDDGLRFVSALTNLEILGLQHSKITDAGLQHLRTLKNLKQLWVGGTEVTTAGRETLRRDLPKLE